jgi:formate dehydrogenase iron-sulfur subunit
MIAEAHRRIREEPGRYINHVYGEHEAGGASQLVLAGMEHNELGLPRLSSAVRSSYADKIMKGLPGWIVGLGLFLGGLYRMEQHQHKPASGSVANTDKE